MNRRGGNLEGGGALPDDFRLSRSFLFARNLGWGLVGQAGSFAVNFLTIPLLLRAMGQELYALYVMLFATASYLLLLSLGAGGATTKYVAQFSSPGQEAELSRALRYGAAYHGLGVLAGALALWPAAPRFAAQVLKVPPHLLDTAAFVLRCAAAGALSQALFQFSSAALQGLQRFDWANGLTLVLNLAVPLGAAALLSAGRGLPAAAMWYAAANAGLAAASLLVLARLAPKAGSHGAAGSFGLREFSLYALSLAPGPAAWIVSFQADKLFIVNALPLAQLALYSIPSGLLQRLQTVPAVISTVLVPMMSALAGGEAEATLGRMYLKSVRLLLWLVLPPLVLLFSLMPQFLRAWLGVEADLGVVWSARLLVVAQVFLLLAYIPNSVAAGRGKPWYLSALAWAQAALSALAWWLLIPRLGIVGAALGALLAQGLPTCVYLPRVHREFLKLGFGRYCEEALLRPFCSAALLLALVFPVHAWAQDWPRLVALGAAGAALYYVSTWLWLSAEDKDLARRFLCQLRASADCALRGNFI